MIAATIDRSTATDIEGILESAEFRDIVLASGLLGVLRRPRLVVSRLWRRFRNLLSRREVTATLGLASTIGDVGGVTSVGVVASKLTQAAAPSQAFAPPYVPLGSAVLGIYRSALAQSGTRAVPPPGSIMLFERSRGGASWLSVGQERKLFDEEIGALERAEKEAAAVKAIQRRFV